MAMASSIRPSIGRILNPAVGQHTANPSSFLALFSRVTAQSCPFSTTPELNERRPRRDNNRLRGLSSLYRSGPRARMNIEPSELPKPSNYKKVIEVDPNHGLWDFFFSKEKLLPTPEEIEEYGRAWTAEELRHKSWEDLHALWWVCVKEQNRIITAVRMFKTFRFKDKTSLLRRLGEVKNTMMRIRHVLTERFYLWEDARALAVSDPEIDLTNIKNPYTPSSHVEEEYSEDPYVEEDAGKETATAEGKQEGAEKSAAEKVEPSTIPADAPEAQQPSTKI
ncbi:MRP-L47-domain-containing protein [Annulohypoxylon maeteangense]|uniref:MRP-L47-domain-containing protein n=1 Tax=Annulohypoxylon maeteangense TaxID=1927788 RepID=UPI0020074613|nr:MRP-L47-domain-containing protein [Annulohypoxylon maeteangense]KAI0888647.1 MRP-L47-domain-containing protein [Annulohypoxylon maeteangense]